MEHQGPAPLLSGRSGRPTGGQSQGPHEACHPGLLALQTCCPKCSTGFPQQAGCDPGSEVSKRQQGRAADRLLVSNLASLCLLPVKWGHNNNSSTFLQRLL